MPTAYCSGTQALLMPGKFQGPNLSDCKSLPFWKKKKKKRESEKGRFVNRAFYACLLIKICI